MQTDATGGRLPLPPLRPLASALNTKLAISKTATSFTIVFITGSFCYLRLDYRALASAREARPRESVYSPDYFEVPYVIAVCIHQPAMGASGLNVLGQVAQD